MEQIVYPCGSGGVPLPVTGRDALRQETAIRLRVPRGSFLYDASLGSRLHAIPEQAAAGENADVLALGYAREALASMRDVQVLGAQVQQTQVGFRVRVELELLGIPEGMEVVV